MSTECDPAKGKILTNVTWNTWTHEKNQVKKEKEKRSSVVQEKTERTY